MNTSLIVTSISGPNEVLRSLACGAARAGWKFCVVGDSKSPEDFHLNHCEFLPLSEQMNLPFAFAKRCPVRHYSRKNIGYLKAIAEGADVIVETDDDNFPREAFFEARTAVMDCIELQGGRWLNVYEYFSDDIIWPRGFPLDELALEKWRRGAVVGREMKRKSFLVHQGLADENPDVDAIFRLTRKLPVVFLKKGAVTVGLGSICPFNSQNTTWFREAFPLLYLPSTCSFRMTDIWRSFIAQAVLHSVGEQVLFHEATVWQERNAHDLMRDFSDEIEGYLGYQRFVRVLEEMRLAESGLGHVGKLRLVYKALINAGFFKSEEEELLEAWCCDLDSIG